jgi:hypothetical protein
MNLYVASSWRNSYQPNVVEVLRQAGHEVYDFRNPAPGNHGFHWSEISEGWEWWASERFKQALSHPLAENGFALDWGAMQAAEGCVLVLPSGRSAHLEAGYFRGAFKPLWILLYEYEPELMYKMATGICLDLGELVDSIEDYIATMAEVDGLVFPPKLRGE